MIHCTVFSIYSNFKFKSACINSVDIFRMSKKASRKTKSKPALDVANIEIDVENAIISDLKSVDKFLNIQSEGIPVKEELVPENPEVS